MNTIDATPLLSRGDDATLVPCRYPLVNLIVRTTTSGLEKPRQCCLWLTETYRREPPTVCADDVRATLTSGGEIGEAGSERQALDAISRTTDCEDNVETVVESGVIRDRYLDPTAPA